MNEHILVSDFMDRQPAVIYCNTPLTKVVQVLISKGVTGAPVINAKKEVLGFISEKDCIKSLLNSSYHAEEATTVNDVMRKEAMTLKPDDSIIDLAHFMEDHTPKVYPVVEDGKLVGVISRAHVLRALYDQQSGSGKKRRAA